MRFWQPFKKAMRKEEPLIIDMRLPEVEAKIKEADALAEFLGEKLKDLNIPFYDHHSRNIDYPTVRIGSFQWETLPPHLRISLDRGELIEFIKRRHESEEVIYVSLESEQHYAVYLYHVFVVTKNRLYIVTPRG